MGSGISSIKLNSSQLKRGTSGRRWNSHGCSCRSLKRKTSPISSPEAGKKPEAPAPVPGPEDLKLCKSCNTFKENKKFGLNTTGGTTWRATCRQCARARTLANANARARAAEAAEAVEVSLVYQLLLSGARTGLPGALLLD